MSVLRHTGAVVCMQSYSPRNGEAINFNYFCIEVASNYLHVGPDDGKVMELHRQLQKADMAVSDAQLKVTNMRKQLYEAKPDGLASDKATRLHLEVTELKRQLELSQSKLHKAQKEVSNQSEIIALMTDSANVHSSIISDLEGRIQAYEKEIIGNEEKIKILSTALADEKRESVSLQEAAASSQQQLQQLKGKDVDCFLRDCVIKNLHLDVNEISLQYRDCYSEVVRQEDILSTLRDENLELRVQTYQLRQEVGRLEAKLAHLSKEAAKGRKEAISESQKHSQALINELELCREQNELLKNNEEASDTKLVNLQVQISCLSEENKTLQERLEISTSVVHELEGSLRDWSERAEELTAEVSSLRETDRKNEVLLSDCELDKQDLAKELDECSAQLSRYASKLHSVVVERDELKQRLDAAKKSVGKVAELEAKLRSLHDDLTFATETVQGQEEVIEKLTGEKATCAEELEDLTRKLVSLESEAKTLRQTVSDQEDELKEMKDATNEVVQLEREVTNLREELVSARTQLAKKENQIRTLTSGKTADAAVTSELENTRRACAQLTAEGEAKSEELMDMVTKLEKAESELRRLCLSEEEMYRALSACESMLSEREARLHDLQQRLVDVECEKVTRLKRASSDLMRPKLCNETLRKSLEAKLRGLTRSEEEIRILNSQIKAQQEELEAYKSLELQYQQLMIQADSQALREVSVELQVWAQQNAALQMEVHTLQKRNDRLALDLRLAQKTLQDSANTNLVAQRSYSKQVQDLSQASLQHQVLLKQFSDKAEQLQEEVATLQTTKAALLDRNTFLEKSSSSLLSELRGLKSRVQEHEQQIRASETRAGAVAEQLQECRGMLGAVLEDVQSRGGTGSHHSSATRCRADPEMLPMGQMDSSNKGLLHSTSRAASLYRNFKEREAELQQQLLSCQNEQVKLIGLVGLLIIEVQALQQKGTVASSPAPSQEALHSVVGRLLQDLGKTAAVNNSLQHSFLTANSSLSRTMGSTLPSDKNLDKCRQKEAAGATTEQLAALRQEKEWLLSEVAMLKKLQEDAVTEVRLCVPEAWWWDDFWQAW